MDINFLDPNYTAWLIPVPPLLAFALIILFLGSSKRATHIVALAGVLTSWVLSWGMFLQARDTTEFGKVAYGDSIDWMTLGTGQPFQMGVLVDPLTAVMLFMVPLAIVCIFIYSIGYMGAYEKDDPHQKRNTRFFAYLSLFAGAMLTLVVADNLLLLFMGWEVMGLCSYLLIGFLYEKKSAYQAAVKAFMTTRVADVFFLVGIGYLYAMTGTLSFREIMYNEEVLTHLAESSAPFLGLSAAALIGIFIVIGTLGKAAQFPFHVWLPDAMEGPTPVSAMIHAAAMVSAGVYLVIRMYPVIAAGGDPHHGDYTEPMILMGIIGSITALGAAVLGVGQNDIKRVLAYSTISQLGFMVAALGIGAYVAAAFHLITHAFFKALLFMSSGAVIHAMEHGEHHAHAHHGDGHGHGHEDHHGHDHGHESVPAGAYGVLHAFEGEEQPEWNTSMVPDGIQLSFVADPNNMQHMGGLWKRIPLVAVMFTIGGMSLAGLPFITAGFWSKDEIFADALVVGIIDHFYWLHAVVFFSLFIAACFTAFYTGRQLLLTFWGEPRSEAAKHATLMKGHYVDEEKLAQVSESPFANFMHITSNDAVVSDELKGKSAFYRFIKVYEDSLPMQLPLVLLAFFAITAGWAGIHPDFPVLNILTGENNFFKNFIKYTILETPETISFASGVPVFFSIIASLGGLLLAWQVYGSKPVKEGETDPAEAYLGPQAWAALQNRFHIDTLFLRYLYVPFEWFGRKITYQTIDNEWINTTLYEVADSFGQLGEAIKRFNYVVIDGVGDGIPVLVGNFSRWFRNLQTGRAQQYMLFAAIALLAMGAVLVLQAIL
jgi:NADH-quinone oxidoreductase subunit L